MTPSTPLEISDQVPDHKQEKHHAAYGHGGFLADRGGVEIRGAVIR